MHSPATKAVIKTMKDNGSLQARRVRSRTAAGDGTPDKTPGSGPSVRAQAPAPRTAKTIESESALQHDDFRA
jgi:hypothetical protein